MPAIMWSASSGRKSVTRINTDPALAVRHVAVAALLHHYLHNVANSLFYGFFYRILDGFLHLLGIEVKFHIVPYQLFDNYFHNWRNRRQFLSNCLGDFLCDLEGRFRRCCLFGSFCTGTMDGFLNLP